MPAKLSNRVIGDVKVLENRDISYSSPVGVRFRRSIKTFRGYLPNEESIGRTIEEDKIKILLEASDSIRNKLLILLLAETGFRIGEILGIRYAKDIDHANIRKEQPDFLLEQCVCMVDMEAGFCGKPVFFSSGPWKTAGKSRFAVTGSYLSVP